MQNRDFDAKHLSAVGAESKSPHRVSKFDSIDTLQAALRNRRKLLLGSGVSLKELVCENGVIVDEEAKSLAERLAHPTDTLLARSVYLPESYRFCFRFYYLAIYMIAGGDVGDESIDDIIQLAGCLVRSKKVFEQVARDLVSEDLLGTLFGLLDALSTETFSAYFEDAVLGGVAAYLGVIPNSGNRGEDAI